jgi:hypothetical protein
MCIATYFIKYDIPIVYTTNFIRSNGNFKAHDTYLFTLMISQV